MNKITNNYQIANTVGGIEQAANNPQPDLFAYVLNNAIQTDTITPKTNGLGVTNEAYNGLYNKSYTPTNSATDLLGMSGMGGSSATDLLGMSGMGGSSATDLLGMSGMGGSSAMDLLGMSNGGSNKEIVMVLLLMLLSKQEGSKLPSNMLSGNGSTNISYPSNISNKVIADAKSMINTKYSQTDCSDLIETVFKKSGIDFAKSPYGTTAAGIAEYVDKTGQTVNKEQLQPGDLIFWQKNGCSCGRYQEIHHVGIYLNENTIIDSLPDGGVQVRDMWGENGNKWHVVKYGRPTR